MTIEKVNNEGDLLLRPIGRLDSLTAGDLEKVIEEEVTSDTKSLTFDLKHVDFVSSKGLRVLVGAYKKMDGREVALRNVNSSIMEVLNLSGLLKIFKINE